MNKNDFIKKLTGHLGKMSKEERDDILADFNEYFTYGVKDGEDEAAVCERLGDPRKIAKEYYSQKMIEEANQQKSFKSMGRAVVASAGLSIVNFFYAICVVAVGYIVIASLYIAICSTGIAGLASLVGSIVLFGVVGPVFGILAIFASILLVALSVLGFIGIMQLAKLFRKGNMHFLNMTRRGIRKGNENE